MADIIGKFIERHGEDVLEALLVDQTTRRNIICADSEYSDHGLLCFGHCPLSRFFGIYRFRYRGIQSVEGIASRFDRGCLTRLSVAAVLVATLRRVRLFRLMPVFTGFGFSVKRCPGPSVFRYPVPAGSS